MMRDPSLHADAIMAMEDRMVWADRAVRRAPSMPHYTHKPAQRRLHHYVQGGRHDRRLQKIEDLA